MPYKDRKDYFKAWYQAHKDEHNSHNKAWRQAHRKKLNEYMNALRKSDTNSFGQTKHSVRVKSRRYLFNVLKHTELKNYEIHHCFGYEDYKKFIYIPKELHLQIHQFLRDNKIDADSNHYIQIEHIIVNYLKFKERHVLVLR